MKAQYVLENLEFERGIDPKAAMDLGIYDKVYRDFTDGTEMEDYEAIASEEDFDMDEEGHPWLDKTIDYVNNETQAYKEFKNDYVTDEGEIRISPFGPIILVVNEYQILTIFGLAKKKDEIIKAIESYDK